jgi:hypothetical protein
MVESWSYSQASPQTPSESPLPQGLGAPELRLCAYNLGRDPRDSLQVCHCPAFCYSILSNQKQQL